MATTTSIRNFCSKVNCCEWVLKRASTLEDMHCLSSIQKVNYRIGTYVSKSNQYVWKCQFQWIDEIWNIITTVILQTRTRALFLHTYQFLCVMCIYYHKLRDRPIYVSWLTRFLLMYQWFTWHATPVLGKARLYSRGHALPFIHSKVNFQISKSSQSTTEELRAG